MCQYMHEYMEIFWQFGTETPQQLMEQDFDNGNEPLDDVIIP